MVKNNKEGVFFTAIFKHKIFTYFIHFTNIEQDISEIGMRCWFWMSNESFTV